MDKYYVVDKSQYTANLPLLIILFIGAIVAWWQVSSLLALVLAGAGLVIMLVDKQRRKKNKTGNSIEVLDKCIILNEDDQSRSIAFNEIKKIKYSNGLNNKNTAIEIQTRINKYKIQLSEYENSDRLFRQLQNKFAAFNCPIVEKQK